jgi:hypothetical protein
MLPVVMLVVQSAPPSLRGIAASPASAGVEAPQAIAQVSLGHRGDG